MLGDDVEIRVLREDDLSFVDEFVQQAGWNQLRVDWLRVLRYEPNGCFAAFSGERLIGTVTTTTYGTDLAWIGMMLVHAEFRRRGIATALMRHGIIYLQNHDVGCIKLDATPEGQFVYEQLGFVEEWKFHRWERSGDQPPQTILPNQVASRIEPLKLLDRIAFGTDRSVFLNKLGADSFTISHDDGFGMIRSGRRASYLGPMTAGTTESAEHILRELVGPLTGRIFWDIPGPNVAAQTFAKQLGFRPIRDLTRMTLGQMFTMPESSMQFAIAAPETG